MFSAHITTRVTIVGVLLTAIQPKNELKLWQPTNPIN